MKSNSFTFNLNDPPTSNSCPACEICEKVIDFKNPFHIIDGQFLCHLCFKKDLDIIDGKWVLADPNSPKVKCTDATGKDLDSFKGEDGMIDASKMMWPIHFKREK